MNEIKPSGGSGGLLLIVIFGAIGSAYMTFGLLFKLIQRYFKDMKALSSDEEYEKRVKEIRKENGTGYPDLLTEDEMEELEKEMKKKYGEQAH